MKNETFDSLSFLPNQNSAFQDSNPPINSRFLDWVPPIWRHSRTFSKVVKVRQFSCFSVYILSKFVLLISDRMCRDCVKEELPDRVSYFLEFAGF